MVRRHRRRRKKNNPGGGDLFQQFLSSKWKRRRTAVKVATWSGNKFTSSNLPRSDALKIPDHSPGRHNMAVTSQIKEHMDVISSDRKTVGKVDHLEGTDKIKLTKQSSPDGQHHHFIPVSWVDHVDQHVHLNKSGADVTSHWQHGRQ